MTVDSRIYFRRENVAKDGYFGDAQWAEYRKIDTTRMMPWSGQAVVQTKEGNIELPPDWTGYIAIDVDGCPYPIEAAIHDASYETVSPEPGEPDG